MSTVLTEEEIREPLPPQEESTPQVEESLPPGEGGEPSSTPPPSPEADPSLNVIIPSMFAQFAFKSAPTMALPEGIPATPESELAQQYVNTTAPILQMIEFHTCLGPASNLPPTARLVIGMGVLVVAAVMMKPRKPKKQKKEAKERDEKVDAGSQPMEEQANHGGDGASRSG